MASQQKSRTRLRIYHGDRIALGPGKVELLTRNGDPTDADWVYAQFSFNF